MSLENLENRRRVGNYWKHLRSCSRKRSNIGPTFKSPFFSFLFPLLHTLPNTKTRKCLFTLSLEYIISRDGQNLREWRCHRELGELYYVKIALTALCSHEIRVGWSWPNVIPVTDGTQILLIFLIRIFGPRIQMIWVSHSDYQEVKWCGGFFFTVVLTYIQQGTQINFLDGLKGKPHICTPYGRSNISHLCIKVTSNFVTSIYKVFEQFTQSWRLLSVHDIICSNKTRCWRVILGGEDVRPSQPLDPFTWGSCMSET